MKKFIRVIVLVMACVLVFATLASCGKSIDKIEKKAKDAGFEVEVEKFDEPVDGVVAVMEITDPNSTSLLGASAEVIEFESADDAKKAAEDAEKMLGELGDAMGYVVKRSGKVVITGSEDIVKKVW